MTSERTLSSPTGEILQRDVTVAPDPASSVEISTNSKGQAVVTVKIYDGSPDAAAAKAIALYQQVCQAVGSPAAA